MRNRRLSSYLPDRDLWSRIRTIILPLSLQALLVHLDSVIDAVMLGKVGQEALASVSLAGQVQFIYNMLMGTCGTAFSIFVAQYWGKKDRRTVEKLLGMSFQIHLLLSAAFFLITTIAPQAVMRIFTDKQVFFDQGGTYLRWIAVSYFFLALSQSFGITCRCTGHARRLLLISCVTVPLDIFFNALFIFGLWGVPRMEVAGAAFATVIVRFIGLALTYLEFRRENLFKVKLFYFLHFSRSLCAHVLRYTFPILGNFVCYGIGMTVAAIIMGHQEPDAVAASALARVIINASCIFFAGIGGGVSVIVGNTLGSGDLARAKDIGRRLLTFALLAGTASVVLMLSAIPFIQYFAKLTPRAVFLTRWMLVLSVPSMIGKANNGVAFTTFNTGGDSKSSFKIDFFVVICFVVPVGLLAAFVFRAPVLPVFFLAYMDEAVKAPIALAHYLKYTWVKNLTVREPAKPGR
ncbi:MAG: polysaccharide biosynthesis C-terminal domain-containing protein [Lentisphaeria bacterium]|nr:polysaccharide biosynthesis C-terminal domain-containing protein [Lentisphaeria bacterium]